MSRAQIRFTLADIMDIMPHAVVYSLYFIKKLPRTMIKKVRGAKAVKEGCPHDWLFWTISIG